MIYKNVANLIEKYDGFFVDVYGVIFDGREFYKGALNTLELMKKSNKKVIILSNTTALSNDCKNRFREKGLRNGVHYDEFISSGEAFRSYLIGLNANAVYQIFNNNKNIFAGTGVAEADSIEQADFIYVGVVNSFEKIYTADNAKTKDGRAIGMEEMFDCDISDIEGFEKISVILKECLKYKKKLIIVNPDIFTLEEISGTIRPVLCQGSIGKFYERMGGEVKYFGKPYEDIFNFAKKFVDKSDKIAMIGDTPWTDILGGNMASLDTILVLTGITGQFFSKHPEQSTELNFERLLNEISSKMTHRNLYGISQKPTYIAESFA